MFLGLFLILIFVTGQPGLVRARVFGSIYELAANALEEGGWLKKGDKDKLHRHDRVDLELMVSALRRAS